MEEYTPSHHILNGNGLIFQLPNNSSGNSGKKNKLLTSSGSSSLSTSSNSIQNVTSLISPESSPILSSKPQPTTTNTTTNTNSKSKNKKELPLIMDEESGANNISLLGNSSSAPGSLGGAFSSTFDQLNNHITQLSQNKVFSDLKQFISNINGVASFTSSTNGTNSNGTNSNKSSPSSPPSNNSTPPSTSKISNNENSSSSSSSLSLSSGTVVVNSKKRDYNSDNEMADDSSSYLNSNISSNNNSHTHSYSRGSSSNNLHSLAQPYNNNNNSNELEDQPVLKKKRSLDLDSFKNNIGNNNSNNYSSYPNSPIIDNNDLQGMVQSQRKIIQELTDYIKSLEQKYDYLKTEHNSFKRKMSASINDLLSIYEKAIVT
ncbi:hypothetical protein DICPUDRAFT_97585 [Dictyostelium purpureum]|uniref:Uncharacterized protein n=1 Tax=Dictyostelium purpureum TaxID=5786 RepID=F0ZI14_DICPU|nr:uncharacterized protein DICPUDRAFT_97585 [Dictyostelium purpureum]EGC36432.1 hypothetical protein DICPUDRAFT_97585 [Dictyostelium purpureum]|eukprot:XP_003287065.1 hypothetical protein DICPUDRAFT_97585 [Dictyostelium purpureum]